MQALMLAAGLGSRMGRAAQALPKCLIEVGGATLLQRAVAALRLAGISRCVLVVGYQADAITRYATENFADMTFTFIRNDEYATTNNVYSLWLAREALLQDDTLLLESDLIYEPELLRTLVNAKETELAAVAPYEQWMDGTVTTLAAGGDIVSFIGKNEFSIAQAAGYYKTINIYKFGKAFLAGRFVPALEAFVALRGKSAFYEMVLKELVAARVSLKAYVAQNLKWYEIDDGQDWEIADTLFAPEDTMLASYGKHFGGYWRYPQMTDFCYLVNPYFPTPALKEKIRYLFDDLLACYPSGMREQRAGAGRVLNVSDDYIAIGNGASEIILGLGKILSGNLAVFIPTFNEYIRCFTRCKITRVNMAANHFKFDVDNILTLIDTVQILAIINPDNPSGSFIAKADMMRILDKCRGKGVTCIIDESFIDFAEEHLRYTLISDTLLQAYPNLIVVKSISKSYGVPGLRLGGAACANPAVRSALMQQLSIWNINSFAEYFFQIFGRYRSSYVTSCNQLAQTRARLAAALGEIGYLSPYPSQANYIMCEVTGQYTAKQLGEALISRYNMLLKTLTVKSGTITHQLIRIAVRSAHDNAALISALHALEHGK